MKTKTANIWTSSEEPGPRTSSASFWRLTTAAWATWGVTPGWQRRPTAGTWRRLHGCWFC